MRGYLQDLTEKLYSNYRFFFLLYFGLSKIGNIHRQGSKQNIFIFSTPRSGSTLLMEVIGAQAKIKIVNEPLNMERQRVFYNLGEKNQLPPTWDFLFPNKDRERVLVEYFKKIEQNQIATVNAFPFSSYYRFVTDRIVYKILRVSDMINWFEECLKAKVVYLIRHPIPTSISRKRLLELPLFFENGIYKEKYLNEKLVRLGNKIIQERDYLSMAVLDWCLRNLPPLEHLDRKNWIFLTYEEMVMKSEDVLNLLCNELELDNMEEMMKIMKKPSGSTKQSDEAIRKRLEKGVVESAEWYINRWRSKISEEKEKRLFDIVGAFEIDIYRYKEDYPASPYLNFQA